MSPLRITVSTLRPHTPYEEGLADFRAAFPRGLTVARTERGRAVQAKRAARLDIDEVAEALLKGSFFDAYAEARAVAWAAYAEATAPARAARDEALATASAAYKEATAAAFLNAFYAQATAQSGGAS